MDSRSNHPVRSHCLILFAALLSSSCSMGFTAQAGYAQLAIDGDIALSATSGGLGGTVSQDLESAFGLGDPRGSPYLRAEADLGVPMLVASLVSFEESGQGTLEANFGGINVGTDVRSELRFTNLKAGLLFDIDLGPVSIAPGLGIDVFDLDLRVADTGGFASERIDVTAPLPMVFLRAQLDLDVVALVVEAGAIRVWQIDGVEGDFWDLEVLLEGRLAGPLHLFAGYRLMMIDAEGTVDGQDFTADLRISGWMIGGGIRF